MLQSILLGHMESVCLSSLGASKLCSIVAVLFYIPPIIYEIQFFCIFASICHILNFSCPMRGVVIFYYIFTLHFSNR